MTDPTSSEKVIRRLYQITNAYMKGFDYQIDQLLKMGLERFDLDIGILSRIHKDSYTVEHCVAPDEIPLQEGDKFDFDHTYCVLTCAADSPVALEHIGENEQYGSHPAYKSFGLESYIGIPIRLNGLLYGTLNFSSHSPYPRQFHDIDIDVMQLMASWIEIELIRREQEAQLKSLNEQLEHQAFYDSLTDIPNRRGMFIEIHKGLNHQLRTHGKASLAIIDIDHFKDVNDVYGHQTGDEVLKAIAKAITRSMRDYDLVARYGGEEFILWLPDANEQECAVVCQRIMQNIAEISVVKEKLSVSIGAYHMKFDNEITEDIEKLLDDIITKADKALYQAKEQGRNRFVSWKK